MVEQRRCVHGNREHGFVGGIIPYGNEVKDKEALPQAFEQGLVHINELFLTSKLYCMMNLLNKIENYAEASIKKLGVSCLDLYLMHWPKRSTFGDATDPPSKFESDCPKFLSRLKKALLSQQILTR